MGLCVPESRRGYIADCFGRKFTICGSLFAWSAITFATGHVMTYNGLLWTRTLMGMSEAFYIPAALALISDFHVGNTRSRARQDYIRWEFIAA